MLIAAGGTGGHMTPALALADELARRGAVVSFATTPSQMARVGRQFAAFPLQMRGFERRALARQNLTTVRQLLRAAPAAWQVITRVRPAVVIGAGGYVSGPVVALAALRGLPTLALEADAHLGVTNRLLAPFVKRVCLAFPIAGLTPPKYVVTGRALTRAQVEASATAGRQLFGLSSEAPVVVAFGGSQGAQSINRALLEAFAGQDLKFQLLHLTGERNYQGVAAELAARAGDPRRYKVLAYTDRLADALAAADLVIARAGGSVAEIAALGKPAILIPYPYASGGHQRKNALWMVEAGAALMIEDEELDGTRLAAAVRELLADEERLRRMAAASSALGRPHATQVIADQVEELLEGRRR